jgi:hypothetical protein
MEMANRIFVNATIYGARITGLRNLWEPSLEYMGKKTDKPNHLTSIIVPKTQALWYNEPILAGFAAAGAELFAKVFQPMSIPFEQIVWPVKDGDYPPAPGKAPIEWCKGHWFISGSSSTPINVAIVQNGQAVPLQNRATVKAGDYVVTSGAIAQKTNDPRGVKLYINNQLFIAPGEEIAVGNSKSSAELMAEAQAKGMAITGFAPAHAGFGGGVPFSQPGAPGGFGVAPGQPNGGPAAFAAPAPMQPPAGFGQPAPSAFPPGQGQPVAPAGFPSSTGFATPQGFAPPR